MGQCALQKLAKQHEGERLSSSSIEAYSTYRGRAISRDNLVLKAEDLCERAVEANKFPVSILEFYGAPGVGKTWLLGTIYDRLRESFGGNIFLLEDFGSYIDLEDVFCGQSALEGNGRKCFDVPLLCEDEDCLKEYEQKFAGKLESILANNDKLSVIVLDNTEWLVFYPRFQEWLEALFLPYVDSGKVLFILAGRYMLRWADFSIRYRLQQVEVPGLTPGELGDLVEKYMGEKDETLTKRLYYNYTWGHTWGSAELLNRMPALDLSKKDLSKEDAISVLEGVVCRLLLHIEKHKADGQHRVQNDLPYELLKEGIILRVFSAVAFKVFYAIAHDLDPKSIKTEKFQSGMRLLQKATLVTWSNEWGGYIVDQPVRYLTSSWLRLKYPKEFVDLHQKAADMHKKQASSYPMVFPSKVIGYLYHKAWAAKADFQDVTTSLESSTKEKLLKEFNQMIEEAFQDIGVKWHGVDLLNELEAYLRHDEELEMLLSREFIDRLLRRVENFRQRFY